MVVSAAGAIENESEFYPFGGELQFSASDPANHYKFTGKERDAESGLDYLGAREFSSTLGRFTIPDWSSAPTPVPYAKLADPQSLNLYSYVENNPINGIDPEGHMGMSVAMSTIDFGRHQYTPFDKHGDGGGGYERPQIDSSAWVPPPPAFEPYVNCRMCQKKPKKTTKGKKHELAVEMDPNKPPSDVTVRAFGYRQREHNYYYVIGLMDGKPNAGYLSGHVVELRESFVGEESKRSGASICSNPGQCVGQDLIDDDWGVQSGHDFTVEKHFRVDRHPAKIYDPKTNATYDWQRVNHSYGKGFGYWYGDDQ
jgi:RHS repeat-associated protein